MSKDPIIELRLGEAGSSFASRNANFVKISQQPAGLNFYEIWFPSKHLGQAILTTDKSTLTIRNVVNLMGTEDIEFKNEGLHEFSINSTLTEADTIPHEEARLKFFEILQNMVRGGWKTTVPLSMARLRGREMTQYYLATKTHTALDPSYVPTPAEWLRMKNRTSYKFYSANTYLTVSFTRDDTMINPSKPGAYLLSFEFKGDIEQFRRYVDPADRKRWREVVKDELRILGERRRKLEEELRQRDMTIDETYMDPPLPDILKM